MVQENIANDLPEIIILDETTFQVKDMNLWFWYGLDAETRAIIHWKTTWNHTNTQCKKFFKELERRYRRKFSLMVNDGGPWYKILPRIGYAHEVVSG